MKNKYTNKYRKNYKKKALRYIVRKNTPYWFYYMFLKKGLCR